jgi:hypothetical protein
MVSKNPFLKLETVIEIFSTPNCDGEQQVTIQG